MKQNDIIKFTINGVEQIVVVETLTYTITQTPEGQQVQPVGIVTKQGDIIPTWKMQTLEVATDIKWVAEGQQGAQENINAE